MSSLISPKICSSPILTCNNKKPRFSHPLQIRAQIRRDHEGRSSNIVDSNLHVLKVRMEEVKNKERLERCCVAEQGWNYSAHVEDFKTINQDKILVEFLEILGLIGSTFGITVFGCSLCLFLISFLIHMN